MSTAAFLTICLGILTAGAVAVIWAQEWGAVQKARTATEKANQAAAETKDEPATLEALRDIKEQCEKNKSCSACRYKRLCKNFCESLPAHWEIRGGTEMTTPKEAWADATFALHEIGAEYNHVAVRLHAVEVILASGDNVHEQAAAAYRASVALEKATADLLEKTAALRNAAKEDGCDV